MALIIVILNYIICNISRLSKPFCCSAELTSVCSFFLPSKLHCTPLANKTTFVLLTVSTGDVMCCPRILCSTVCLEFCYYLRGVSLETHAWSVVLRAGCYTTVIVCHTNPVILHSQVHKARCRSAISPRQAVVPLINSRSRKYSDSLTFCTLYTVGFILHGFNYLYLSILTHNHKRFCKGLFIQ